MTKNYNNDGVDVALPAAAAALSVEDRAGLVNALKHKLHIFSDKHSYFMETVSPNVRTRVEVLREIQSQHDELEQKYFEERAALEAKYQKLYQPLYSKRYEIVNGLPEVEGAVNGDLTNKEVNQAPEEKGVPEFWLTAMKNNLILADEILERDEEALKYLKDIKWCRTDDPKGFKLEFLFDPNPYFKNSVLTKTYDMIDDDEPVLEKANGTEIEWYPGKCLTLKLLKKKPRKGSKNTKPITKSEKCASFFNFFKPPAFPEDPDEIDPDTAEELQDQMDQDYTVGTTIRDKIIPHAVSWFTGEADGDDCDDMEDDINSEDYDEEDEEDEDEDEEDEDSDVKDRKNKSGKQQQAGGGRPSERAPDCKQQ
ncbi:hypothetical protein ACOSP7_020123 [Xanthoceras sorbifolium]